MNEIIVSKMAKVKSTGYLKRKLGSEIDVFPDLKNPDLEVFPVVNIENEIVSYQTIHPLGRKQFAKGLKAGGAFYPIGNFIEANEIILCEGIATGYSIARCTHTAVLCVLSVGNFEKVYLSLKNKYPDKKIIFAADNDHTKKKNVGLETIKTLSKKYNVQYVAPKSTDVRIKDFNDVEQICGGDIVEQQFKFDLKSELNIEVEVQNDISTEYDYAKNFVDKVLIHNGLRCAYLINDELYLYKDGFYEVRKKHDLKVIITRFYQNNFELVKKIKISFLNSVVNHVEAMLFTENKSVANYKISDPDLKERFIVFKNGVGIFLSKENPESIRLIPHSPEYFSVCKLPYNYDPKADCPIFKSFLIDVLPDDNQQKLIWEWFGYNLLSDINFGKALMLIGSGANGKSVITTVLVQLLGVQNTTSVGLDAFDHKRTFPLAAMNGKLANVVEDINEIQKAPEGILKSIITGGQITVERKNNHPQTIIINAKQTFAANNFPRFSDSTDGIYRRFIIIPMEKQILDPSKQDKRLINPEFWQASGELTGILNEALKGLARLMKQGHFTEPISSVNALQAHRLENNPARQFLIDNYSEGLESDQIYSPEVYSKYKDYCESNGYRESGSAKFSKEVQRAFKTVKRTETMRKDPKTQKRGHFYLGLKLIDDADSSDSNLGDRF